MNRFVYLTAALLLLATAACNKKGGSSDGKDTAAANANASNLPPVPAFPAGPAPVVDYAKFNIDTTKLKKYPSGLQVYVKEAGSMAQPNTGSTIIAHYKGMLPDGKQFDSSYDRGAPAEFNILGVIPGWTQAFLDMKVGTKATLLIPPHLGYGSQGAGELIPPNSTLVFEVEFVGIK